MKSMQQYTIPLISLLLFTSCGEKELDIPTTEVIITDELKEAYQEIAVKQMDLSSHFLFKGPNLEIENNEKAGVAHATFTYSGHFKEQFYFSDTDLLTEAGPLPVIVKAYAPDEVAYTVVYTAIYEVVDGVPFQKGEYQIVSESRNYQNEYPKLNYKTLKNRSGFPEGALVKGGEKYNEIERKSRAFIAETNAKQKKIEEEKNRIANEKRKAEEQALLEAKTKKRAHVISVLKSSKPQKISVAELTTQERFNLHISEFTFSGKEDNPVIEVIIFGYLRGVIYSKKPIVFQGQLDSQGDLLLNNMTGSSNSNNPGFVRKSKSKMTLKIEKSNNISLHAKYKDYVYQSDILVK